MIPYKSLSSLLIRVKRKVFVSYHHESDQAFRDSFSRSFDNSYDVVTDNSLSRAVDSDDPGYVMRRIRENYITGTSCTIVLCGPGTRWRKYIDWEIKATLDKAHGLIGVHLPTNLPGPTGGVHKPDRLQDNIDSKYAVWADWTAFTSSPSAVQATIEKANATSKALIANSRALRRRNGQ